MAAYRYDRSFTTEAPVRENLYILPDDSPLDKREGILRATDIPGFEQLSGPEKILLVEEIWDTIAEDETEVPVPNSHLKELDSRLSRHHSSPGRLLALEELQQRIQTRK